VNKESSYNSILSGWGYSILNISLIETDDILNMVIGKFKKYLSGKSARKDLLFELLMFYHYITQAHMVSVYNPTENERRSLLPELKSAIEESAFKNTRQGTIVRDLMRSDYYNVGVVSYLAEGDLSPVDSEEFSRWSKIFFKEEQVSDYIKKTYLTSYFRILNALDMIEDQKVSTYSEAFFPKLWFIHAGRINDYRKILKNTAE
jgi:hypothetical protein